MERVLVVDRENIPSAWLQNRYIKKLTEWDFTNSFNTYGWLDRDYAEKDESVKQLIPYIILKDRINNRIGIYQRHGSEKRIHGLFSIGVGGHISDVDNLKNGFLLNIVKHSAKRELGEELIGLDIEKPLNFIGVMNEEETKVGRTHIALVFVMELDVLPEGDEELLNFDWKTKQEVRDGYKLELWSEMAMELIDV